MGFLQAQPVPGWTVEMTRTQLDEPLEVHGQQLTEYVSLVEFRAEDGGIAPDQFEEFALSGGPFPDADQVSFPSVQLYSDGSEAAWIEPTVDGEEPERPAPTLTLTAGGDEEPASDEIEAETASTHGESDGGAPVGLTLFISLLALLVGIAGVVLGWRAQRRTVSS